MSKDIKKIRNFTIAGHTGTGKTSLIDAMLYRMGISDRLGSTANKTSVADYLDEEKERQITITAKFFSGTYKSSRMGEIRMVFADTPGYTDFFGQTIAAISVTDMVLITSNAISGPGVGGIRVWRYTLKTGKPKGVIITGIDDENANFDIALEKVRKVFGNKCIPLTIPAPDGKIFSVFSQEVPKEIEDKVEEIKNNLIEIAAETDDYLLERYLEGEQLSEEEIYKGLTSSIISGKLVPVFTCIAPKMLGIDEFMETASLLFPSPFDYKCRDVSGNIIDPSPSAPLVSYVWRIANDPFIGQLTFVRVYGGTCKIDNEILNVNVNQKEKLTNLINVNGKIQENVTEAVAGEIVAIPKLKNSKVSHTLCASNITVKLPELEFPQPVYSVAVDGKTRADSDKLMVALQRIVEEDPTLKIERNTETKQTILSGLGDVHIDVAVSRMKNRNNVDVILNPPLIAYRETVTATGEGHYKHKKQTGGRGQYGEVYLRVEPKSPDDPEWFVDAIVGGVIPGNFMPAVQKGVLEGMSAGALAGYPVTDVKVTVYDGSYHEVDSSEISFKIAASRAFKDGMLKAKPVLLEPIMNLKVWIPEQYMGAVTGDLNQKRGRILGMDHEEGMHIISAEVPLAELFKYAAELRSITSGQGSFEMKFARYDKVPNHIAEKIIAEAKKRMHEEED